MSTAKTYRIGEVAKMLHLKTHVLRFWEDEFPQIAPFRTKKGQRYYTAEDIERIRRIQRLLHEQGMTIVGARRVLAENPEVDEYGSLDSPPKETGSFKQTLIQELNVIRNLLANSGTP